MKATTTAPRMFRGGFLAPIIQQSLRKRHIPHSVTSTHSLDEINVDCKTPTNVKKPAFVTRPYAPVQVYRRKNSRMVAFAVRKRERNVLGYGSSLPGRSTNPAKYIVCRDEIAH